MNKRKMNLNMEIKQNNLNENSVLSYVVKIYKNLNISRNFYLLFFPSKHFIFKRIIKIVLSIPFNKELF